MTAQAEVKSRPILFSGAMVRAILEGRKTQTRRIVKMPPFDSSDSGLQVHALVNLDKCPYGKAGDRLWVRETFWIEMDSEWSEWDHKTYYSSLDLKDPRADVHYVATEPGFQGHDGICTKYEKRPSIFMPRWASRITLEITGVRLERLQDISEQDAIAEGVEKIGDLWKCYDNCPEHPRHGKRTSATASFMSLWDSINKFRNYGWDVNPWVWVIDFQRAEQ